MQNLESMLRKNEDQWLVHSRECYINFSRALTRPGLPISPAWLRLCHNGQTNKTWGRALLLLRTIQCLLPSLQVVLHSNRCIIPFPHKSYVQVHHYPQEASVALVKATVPLSQSFSGVGDKCALPFLSPNGEVVFFDVQSATPGTFMVPGVVDLETYEPGSMLETSWIFFKGDPQAGLQPGHPFERPFNDSARFSIDMMRDDDTRKVLHEIMRKSFLLQTLSQRDVNKGTQRGLTHPLSGEAARHSVDRAATRCTSRDSTVRASTTPLAR